MTLTRLLNAWQTEPSIADCIAARQTEPARQPQYTPFPEGLNPALIEALKAKGISALYTHQYATWEHVHQGRNIIVVTSTASGKTLCYNLPVLNYLYRHAEGRALYLFPTKALAQDQFSTLQEITQGASFPYPRDSQSSQKQPLSPIPIAIYDGDTPASARPAIRKQARLLITNPDMLHMGILPHHTAWSEFLRNLHFIVIDELHIYRGVFGSHVANVLRRLKRLTRFYGSHPQFILTSATIANPIELAQKLIEEDVVLVDNDGSARGPRHFLIYNPPIVNQELGLRRSALIESVRLAEDLLAYDIQTILFGRSRRSVELILTYLTQKTAPTPKPHPKVNQIEKSLIRGYRSGYLPEERRKIEQGLRSGAVRLVVATNALELGVDIGGMGASLLVGYPGTIAATRQQAGRAGRGQEPSVAILVATANPLDQFLAHHPDYFFGQSPEQALINPDNPLILLAHLRCAVFELPFEENEAFGKLESTQVHEFLEFLRSSQILHYSQGRYYWMADNYPAEGVSLRSASPNHILLQNQTNGSTSTIGQVDYESAPWMVHPGAVYIHEGRTFLVENLDLEQYLATLREVDLDYYTEPITETTIQLLEKYAESDVRGATKAQGEIKVTTQLVGFRKIRWFTHEVLGIEEINLPPTELLTTAYWLSLSDDTVNQIRERGLWRNDPNQYGPNWGTQRDLARARDAYRCQVCGAPETGRAHDVHHKIPFRFFKDEHGTPDFIRANMLDNLVTLCPACHRRAETGVYVRSGLAGLAYAIAHLAPLFLMCDRNDIGIHSDPQSNLSLGRPTIILYDRIPAGIGLSQKIYESHDLLLSRVHELIATCECSDGCPSCVGPGGENGLGGKPETLAILSLITPTPL